MHFDGGTAVRHRPRLTRSDQIHAAFVHFPYFLLIKRHGEVEGEPLYFIFIAIGVKNLNYMKGETTTIICDSHVCP